MERRTPCSKPPSPCPPLASSRPASYAFHGPSRNCSAPVSLHCQASLRWPPPSASQPAKAVEVDSSKQRVPPLPDLLLRTSTVPAGTAVRLSASIARPVRGGLHPPPRGSVGGRCLAACPWTRAHELPRSSSAAAGVGERGGAGGRKRVVRKARQLLPGSMPLDSSARSSAAAGGKRRKVGCGEEAKAGSTPLDSSARSASQ